MAITYAKNVGLIKMPPIIEIGGITYGTVEVNGIIWLAEDLKNDIGDYRIVNGEHYYKPSSSFYTSLMAILPAGWRVETENDLSGLLSFYSGHLEKLCSTDGWNGIGTNESGLNFLQKGALDYNATLQNAEQSWHMRQYDASRPGVNTDTSSLVIYNNNGIISSYWGDKEQGSYNRGWVPLRCCCNA